LETKDFGDNKKRIEYVIGINLKDRRGDQRGGEWEPIKIPQGFLTYIPNSTQIHNLQISVERKPRLAVEKPEQNREEPVKTGGV
jgi:hypothetical protein